MEGIGTCTTFISTMWTLLRWAAATALTVLHGFLVPLIWRVSINRTVMTGSNMMESSIPLLYCSRIVPVARRHARWLILSHVPINMLSSLRWHQIPTSHPIMVRAISHGYSFVDHHLANSSDSFFYGPFFMSFTRWLRLSERQLSRCSYTYLTWWMDVLLCCLCPGPTNCKLRCHLPLVVPEGGSSQIRVGDQVITLEEGRWGVGMIAVHQF